LRIIQNPTTYNDPPSINKDRKLKTFDSVKKEDDILESNAGDEMNTFK